MDTGKYEVKDYCIACKHGNRSAWEEPCKKCSNGFYSASELKWEPKEETVEGRGLE